MNVIVNVACTDQQSSLQVFGKLGILLNAVFKSSVAFFTYLFLNPMVFLAPPAVVYIVLMISGWRYGNLEEIRINQHSRCWHESTTRMTKNAYLIDIYKIIPFCQLFQSCFFILQTIVSQIIVSIVVVPFWPGRVSTTVPNGNYNKTKLCQAIDPVHSCWEGFVNGLGLRTRVNIGYYGITPGWIKIKWFVHHPVNVCNAVTCLYFIWFGKFVTCFKQFWQIGGIQVHQLVALVVAQYGLWNCIYPWKIVDEKVVLVIETYTKRIASLIQQF